MATKGFNLPGNFVSNPEDIRRHERRRRIAEKVKQQNQTSPSPSESTPPPIQKMANWEFPHLVGVETIKSFNGDADKLDDFAVSVEAYIYSRELPLRHGGWVKPDEDDGWIHCPLPASDAATAQEGMRKNYRYSKRFCMVLAERFTDAAREWWITAGKDMGVNCWRRAADR